MEYQRNKSHNAIVITDFGSRSKDATESIFVSITFVPTKWPKLHYIYDFISALISKINFSNFHWSSPKDSSLTYKWGFLQCLEYADTTDYLTNYSKTSNSYVSIRLIIFWILQMWGSSKRNFYICNYTLIYNIYIYFINIFKKWGGSVTLYVKVSKSLSGVEQDANVSLPLTVKICRIQTNIWLPEGSGTWVVRWAAKSGLSRWRIEGEKVAGDWLWGSCRQRQAMGAQNVSHFSSW